MAMVDVLMPVRNAEPFLDEAVESILSQTFTDWRLIAVDDRSSDGTWGMLCTYGKTDDRILALKTEGPGIVRALNTAFTHSRAPFLARMDADDISEPHRLAELLTLFDGDPSAGVVGSRVAVFPPDAITPNMRRYIDWQNTLITADHIRRERYVESTVMHATAMFRREILVRTGGWREGVFPEDLDLWLRLHREGVKIVKHPEVLYRWREHDHRETRSSERCTPAVFHSTKVLHLAEELMGRDASRVAVLGPEQTRNRWVQSLKEKGFDVLSISWKPGDPIPRQASTADFTLAAFGVPDVRTKAREELTKLGEEEDRWLFVG
jgi:glycosyltransferase involved in cell wall biosynthesis